MLLLLVSKAEPGCGPSRQEPRFTFHSEKQKSIPAEGPGADGGPGLPRGAGGEALLTPLAPARRLGVFAVNVGAEF